MRKFFVEFFAGYVLERGLDRLGAYIDQTFLSSDEYRLNELDKTLIRNFSMSMPRGYRKFGMLFELYIVSDDSGVVDHVLLPRGYGQTAVEALVNDSIRIDTEEVELPTDVRSAWAERRMELQRLTEDPTHSVRRAGIWWELDPVTLDWSSRTVDLDVAEQNARDRIRNMEGLAELSRAGPELQVLRANATSWFEIERQLLSAIEDAAVRGQIQRLANENEAMVKAIEEAAAKLKKAQELSGFMATLNMLSTLLNLGASFQSENAAVEGRMVALENYSLIVIEKAGNEMRRTNIELRNVFGGYVSPGVMPSFSMDTIHRITNPPRN